MAKTAASIWNWSLPVLPFTVIITLIVAFFTDRLIDNHSMSRKSFFEILVVRVSASRVYFFFGICLFLPQVLAIIIGRFQFLLKTQSMINRTVLFIIHIFILVPFVYLLVYMIISNNHPNIYQMSIYGIFESISLYCLVHTILIFYLYIRRSNASQHANIIWPIWFLICIISLIVFYVIWTRSHNYVSGFIVILCPFLYLLGFVHQFWLQARAKQRYFAVVTA
ncbi:hypothetical protein I4U23_004115 [Adineta vaga]|nr:hypothetical protein I4U23_004115 [Adineta vaga]